MLDHRIAEIARGQHGVIARSQLLACGLSSSTVVARVRRSRLFPILHGVFALSPHVDAWGLRYAAILSAGGIPVPPTVREAIDGSRPADATLDQPVHAQRLARDPMLTWPAPAPADASVRDPCAPANPREFGFIRLVVLSHWSVLDVHGLIAGPPARMHVTLQGTGSRRPGGVRIHRARTLKSTEIELVRGIPMTTPARTILDAAIGAAEHQIRRLIREAEFRELIGFGDVADVVRRNPFHPGSRIVRSADPQTAESRLRQTPIEDDLAAIVGALPIDAPESQVTVTGLSGRTYRADFAWPHLRLIVETDGRSSHDRSTSFQSDRERDADLAAAGWLTLRFTTQHLATPERVAATIVATARTRTS